MSLHHTNVALFWANRATYPTDAIFCQGFYNYPLAFLVWLYYLVVPLIWAILLHLTVAPYQLSLDGRRVLASLIVLSHILDISIGLEELAYLYELRNKGKTFSFVAHDCGQFLVMIIAEDEEEGGDRKMLN